MKKLILMLAAITVTTAVTAQYKKDKKKDKKEEKRRRIDALIKQEEEGVIAYHKHSVMGLKLTTDGYGAFFEIGRSKSVKKALLFQFEITERKHQKEEKTNTALFAAPFIYGKLNYFYPIKLGVQQQILLGNKSNKNGLSITGNIGGGITVGLLRPYELEVDKNGERVKVRYDSPDSLFFVNADSDPSVSGPNIGVGWNHLKVTPGLYLKPALRFDYGRMNELVSAIEVGLHAEFYAKKIPQMLYLKERQFFFGAYFALLFGRRK